MRRLLFLSVLLLSIVGLASPPAGAQTTATDAISAIVDEIDATGRYVDPAALPLGTGVDAAIVRANAAGIAVVLPDPAADAETLSPAIDTAMRSQISTYDSVLVLTPTVIAAEVGDVSEAELNQALDAAFATSGDANVIDAFVASITGEATPTNASPTTPVDDSGSTADGASTSDSSGGGFPWFWAFLAAVAAFFGIRFFSNRRKRKTAEHTAIETDRDEIAEQLRNNADRVIDLGDPVIATKNAELIALYEEASTTYQEVSLALPAAITAAEIDALDDRIDTAEWQLEVIAARLAGEPEPPSPADRERAAAPPAPTGPALGPDDSIFGTRPDGQTPGSRLPPPQSPPRTQPRQRSSRSGGMSGGMSSGMGGMLGSILGQILLGGGRPRSTSRRTQRRSASSGSFGSSTGGGFPDPFSRTKRPGGRSLGRSGNGGSTRRAGGSRTRSTSSRRAGGSRRR